jgi:tRNA-dihydrouridine synthase
MVNNTTTKLLNQNKMNERHLKETIQRQADKIKELEADWLDEYTKCQLIGKEIEKLNKIINFIQRGMEGNEQFQQVIRDLKGGTEC